MHPFLEVVIERTSAGFVARAIHQPIAASGSSLPEVISNMLSTINQQLQDQRSWLTEDNLILYSPETLPRRSGL